MRCESAVAPAVASCAARAVPCTMRARGSGRSPCPPAALRDHRRRRHTHRRPAWHRRFLHPASALHRAGRRAGRASCVGTDLAHDGHLQRSRRRCSDSARRSRIRSATSKSAERWIASLPANDPLATHASVIAELGTLADARRARTPARARGRVPRRRACRRPAQRPDDAIHRARESQLEDREPAVVGAVRPHAGVPACYAAFAREIADHVQRTKWQALLPRAHRAARSSTSAATRRSGSIAASSGSRRNGRSCTRCSRCACSRQIEREPLRARAPAAARRRSSTSILHGPGAAARRTRQPHARASSNGSPASSTSGASRCGSRSSRRR